MRSPLAGLTTRGRCLIAAGTACAVCSVFLDERDLLRIGALVVALPVLSALLCGWSLLRLDVTRSVCPQPLEVGADAQVELRLRAQSRTPVGGLIISDAVPGDCGLTATYSLGGLKAGATTTMHYPLAPRLRGRRRLGPLRVSLADPLGLVELVRTVGDGTSVLVRPRVEPLDGPLSAAGAGSEHSPAVRRTGQQSAAHAVRDAQLRAYAAGDDMRTIHWRSTARRGELMVRTPEHGHSAGTVVLLDIRRSSHSGVGTRSSLERAVSVAASVAAHLQRVGNPVRVLTTDGVQLADGAPGLEQLALLQTSDRADLGAVLDLVGTDELIAVLGRLDTASAARLLEGRGRTGSARALHLLPSDGAAVLNAAGWRTVEAGSTTPLWQLWPALSRRSPAAR